MASNVKMTFVSYNYTHNFNQEMDKLGINADQIIHIHIIEGDVFEDIKNSAFIIYRQD